MSKKHEDTRQLPVALTEHELLDFGQQLARANTDHLCAEERKKLTNQQLKGDVDAKAARVSQLTSIVSSREEVRPVKCLWTMNLPKMGKKSLIRLDTQAVVETRDMVGDDMQPELEPIVKEAEKEGERVRDIGGTVIEAPKGLPAPGESTAGKKRPPRKSTPGKKPSVFAIEVDWKAVKAAFLETRSIKATAEKFNINPNTLKARIRREKWNQE